ncbi:hypothetical protein COLO4_32981 [Corchorus olitorius]|uniref:hAT-like transposase RNase-H fold domain-containing protein n=1 Tax=Corchorus olitorius TaxID=93759 RepID=A0A1R3GX84_9ROSI|nr:hypothetical protein COLO4_32981 [Corchorus olitorius]
MARKMQLKFDKYWGHCNLLVSIAAVLDPRNKMDLIDFAYSVIYSRDEAVRQKQILRESLNELYEEYVDAYKAANAESSQSNLGQESEATNSVSTTIGKTVLTGRSKYERPSKTKADTIAT